MFLWFNKKKQKKIFNKETYCVIGLGNYKSLYNNTRHNIGFAAIDEICKNLKINLELQDFGGIFLKGRIDNKINFIIGKPIMMMNNSGNFVRDLVNYYKLDINKILIIYDCIDIKQGKIKLSNKVKNLNHNGIKNVVDLLKTNEIKTLRIGIGGAKRKDQLLTNYVLGKLSASENIHLNSVISLSYDIFCDFLTLPFEQIMQKYNNIFLKNKDNDLFN